MQTGGPIRVLIVHDSPRWYAALAGALGAQSGIRVCEAAASAHALGARILAAHPDAVVIDLALPEPVAVPILRNLREHYPVPIFACSSGRRDRTPALSAIEHGVLDVVIKPRGLGRGPWRRLAADLAQRLRAAIRHARPVGLLAGEGSRRPALSFRKAGIDPRRHLMVVGASTGGPEALRELLGALPADAPPVAIVQHMPAMFTGPFAERLDAAGVLSVGEAREGDPLAPGRVLVARGDTHLTVRRGGAGWFAHYTDQRRVNLHCPSVDVLFDSAVAAAGAAAIGVLLTGMGDDGARGLLRLHECGALTAAQDPRSCVVDGMPKVARELGAADVVAAPADLPARLIEALVQRKEVAAAFR